MNKNSVYIKMMQTKKDCYLNIEINKYLKLNSSYLSIENKCHNLHFLEHILENDKPTKRIICNDNEMVYISYDLGETFTQIFKNRGFKSCFTTKKYHILGNIENDLYIYDNNKYKLVNIIKNIKHKWLGSWSITDIDNVVLFGEYGDYDNEMCIYKSIDYGLTFKKSYIYKNTSEEKIRHFHTCYNIGNKCYISSGDNLLPNEIHIWESLDKGSTFNKINFNKNNFENVNNRLKESFPGQSLKHTCYSYIKNQSAVYWGTDTVFDMSIDDNKKIWKAGLVKFNPKENIIQLIDTINYNPIRAQYNINDRYLLFFSEQRRFSDKYFKSSEIGIFDLNTKKYNVIYTFSDIDSLKTKTSFNFFSVQSKYIYQENNNFIFFLEITPHKKNKERHNGGIMKFTISVNN
jgi:hypothetical protein